MGEKNYPNSKLYTDIEVCWCCKSKHHKDVAEEGVMEGEELWKKK